MVENAIRLAIDSIINVLYGVNGARAHEQQRMVADRDKEIQRLERRLGEIEQELQVTRRQGCSCGLFGSELSLGSAQSSTELHRAEQSSLDSNGGAAAGQECEMSFSRKYESLSGLQKEVSSPPKNTACFPTSLRYEVGAT